MRHYDEKYNVLSVIGGGLLFLLYLSGRFTTERIGVGDYEVRFLLVVVCAAWALIVIPINGVRREGVEVLFLCAAFFFVSCIFAFRNEGGALVTDKVIDLAFLLALVFFAYVIISNDFSAAKVFLICMGLAGFLYSSLVLLSVGDAARGSTGVGGPNVATRIIFMGLVSVVFFAEYSNKKLLYLLVPVYLAGIVGIGSRGGMVVAFMMMIGWVAIFVLRSGPKNVGLVRYFTSFIKKVLMFMVVSAGFLWFFFPLVSSVFQARVMNLLIDRVHYAGRDVLYANSIDAIYENFLLGLGLGGYERIGISNYPHNIFMELFLDGGVFMGAFFFVFLGFSIYALFKSRAATLSFILMYMLLVQMFSGDYYDFRFYFVYLMIVFAFFIVPNKPKSSSGQAAL